MKAIREFLEDYWFGLVIAGIFVGLVTGAVLDECGENGHRRREAWAECQIVCGEYPVKRALVDSTECVCDTREAIRTRK